MMKYLKIIIRVAAETMLVALETLLWAGYALSQAITLSGDLRRARKVLQSGVLQCPGGHEVETRGVFECRLCGFVYEGSVWRCENRECRGMTPYTSCPTCGLSVRNPYRLGTP